MTHSLWLITFFNRVSTINTKITKKNSKKTFRDPFYYYINDNKNILLSISGEFHFTKFVHEKQKKNNKERKRKNIRFDFVKNIHP